MKLKSQDLLFRLKNEAPPMGILLYGQEAGLVMENAGAIRLAVMGEDEEEAEFDAETFYAGDLNEERFLTSCQSLPFMAKRRLVTIREADQLPPKVRETVLAYLKKPSPTTVLLITAGPLEAGNPLRKRLESNKKMWCVPFYPLEGAALNNWLRGRLKEAGFQVDRDALMHLGERLEGDTRVAGQELEKLALFMGKERSIGLTDVMAVVGETANASPFALAAAVTGGQGKEALTILDKLLESGEEPLMLLALITRRIRQLVKGRALLDQGVHPDKAARELKIFWKEQKPFFAQCRTLPGTAAASALLYCLEADAGLKGGGPPARQTLERLVIRIVALIPGRPEPFRRSL
ncbi:MAG: DNA polymerase III subunit delta [Magnetococcales bacterium]|nr:DNA polymerase III subunit delta [Magnetococcales bacterium]